MKWQLTLEQHNHLAKILLKSRPSFNEGRVNLFLDNVGRIVNSWLNWVNDGDPVRVSDDLGDVASLAGKLYAKLKRLSPNARFALGKEFIRQSRNVDRDPDYRDIFLELDRMENFVCCVNSAAIEANGWQDELLRKRLQRDLLQLLAAEHARTLGRMPSANRNGSFGKFAAELVGPAGLFGSYLPENHQFKFGHVLLKDAVSSAADIPDSYAQLDTAP